MFDPTDEQIDEAARHEAMRTVRDEAKARRQSAPEFIGAETCHYGESHRLRQCDCEWLDGAHATTDLATLWEEASGEGQVVS